MNLVEGACHCPMFACECSSWYDLSPTFAHQKS